MFSIFLKWTFIEHLNVKGITFKRIIEAETSLNF